MTAAEQLATALEDLQIARAAWRKALSAPQYVQSNQRRMQQFEIDKLGAEVKRLQAEVDRLDAIVNGTPRPGINGPLRAYL